jgi:hypothetical protein
MSAIGRTRLGEGGNASTLDVAKRSLITSNRKSTVIASLHSAGRPMLKAPIGFAPGWISFGRLRVDG